MKFLPQWLNQATEAAYDLIINNTKHYEHYKFATNLVRTEYPRIPLPAIRRRFYHGVLVKIRDEIPSEFQNQTVCLTQILHEFFRNEKVELSRADTAYCFRIYKTGYAEDYNRIMENFPKNLTETLNKAIGKAVTDPHKNPVAFNNLKNAFKLYDQGKYSLYALSIKLRFSIIDTLEWNNPHRTYNRYRVLEALFLFFGVKVKEKDKEALQRKLSGAYDLYTAGLDRPCPDRLSNREIPDIQPFDAGHCAKALRLTGMYSVHSQPQPQPQPQPSQEEKTMDSTVKVETRHFVNDVDIRTLSEDQCFEALAEMETKIKKLEAIEHKPKRLHKKIKTINKAILKLVKLIDEK